nr:Uncharacterised protein [Streptococcus thermophilus]
MSRFPNLLLHVACTFPVNVLKESFPVKKRTGLIAAALSATMIFGSTTPAFADDANDGKVESFKDNDNDTSSEDEDKDEDKEEDKSDDKGPWDKNGASSEGPWENGGSFPDGSSGLNRLEAYLNSNHFESISAIVAAIAGLITVSTQVIALIIQINPAAKKQFEALFKK